jgi:phage tail-like protein
MALLQKTASVSKPADTKTKPLTSYEEFPIPSYQFSLEIGTDVMALFQTVSGLSVKREVETVTAGGQNNYVHELPGQISYGHVTLETGLTLSSFFWDWMMTGQEAGSVQKMDISIVQRHPDPKGGTPLFVEVKRWNFHKAFPVSWKISDLSVDNTQKIVIESLELSFEFFELKKP